MYTSAHFIELFSSNLSFSNVWKFAQGDLATEPLIAGYEDYTHICRTPAIEMDQIRRH